MCMTSHTLDELKRYILEYLSRFGSSGIYKYNLTGTDARGLLEIELGETWTKEQRLEAAHAFDELKADKVDRIHHE